MFFTKMTKIFKSAKNCATTEKGLNYKDEDENEPVYKKKRMGYYEKEGFEELRKGINKEKNEKGKYKSVKKDINEVFENLQVFKDLHNQMDIKHIDYKGDKGFIKGILKNEIRRRFRNDDDVDVEKIVEFFLESKALKLRFEVLKSYQMSESDLNDGNELIDVEGKKRSQRNECELKSQTKGVNELGKEMEDVEKYQVVALLKNNLEDFYYDKKEMIIDAIDNLNALKDMYKEDGVSSNVKGGYNSFLSKLENEIEKNFPLVSNLKKYLVDEKRRILEDEFFRLKMMEEDHNQHEKILHNSKQNMSIDQSDSGNILNIVKEVIKEDPHFMNGVRDELKKDHMFIDKFIAHLKEDKMYLNQLKEDKRFKKSMKIEFKMDEGMIKEVKDEIKPSVEIQIRKSIEENPKHMNDIKYKIEETVKDDVKDELRIKLTDEVKEELRKSLRNEVKDQLKDNVNLQIEVKEDIKQSGILNTEVMGILKEELKPKAIEELKIEMKKEVFDTAILELKKDYKMREGAVEYLKNKKEFQNKACKELKEDSDFREGVKKELVAIQMFREEAKNKLIGETKFREKAMLELKGEKDFVDSIVNELKGNEEIIKRAILELKGQKYIQDNAKNELKREIRSTVRNDMENDEEIRKEAIEKVKGILRNDENLKKKVKNELLYEGKIQIELKNEIREEVTKNFKNELKDDLIYICKNELKEEHKEKVINQLKKDTVILEKVMDELRKNLKDVALKELKTEIQENVPCIKISPPSSNEIGYMVNEEIVIWVDLHNDLYGKNKLLVIQDKKVVESFLISNKTEIKFRLKKQGEIGFEIERTIQYNDININLGDKKTIQVKGLITSSSTKNYAGQEFYLTFPNGIEQFQLFNLDNQSKSYQFNVDKNIDPKILNVKKRITINTAGTYGLKIGNLNFPKIKLNILSLKTIKIGLSGEIIGNFRRFLKSELKKLFINAKLFDDKDGNRKDIDLYLYGVASVILIPSNYIKDLESLKTKSTTNSAMIVQYINILSMDSFKKQYQIKLKKDFSGEYPSGIFLSCSNSTNSRNREYDNFYFPVENKNMLNLEENKNENLKKDYKIELKRLVGMIDTVARKIQK